ncbi:tyrosine-protein phosphatase vhp-1 [Caerostris extrusa]|uniref:protein-tyrosine-phosphatase n=1 Tax=Caerostris extrusa TaxID=172846 RepID=A0AAV4PTB0_CAEEX|nr:tyrosine-protein phosphatase vhp-1 [Caerostris extrusa]
MRIPVSDTYSEKLLPYFPKAFHFLDKVRQGNGCVLVHCLAGISRSPTVAIAYVMQHLRLSSDDGYRYVKSKRPTISPNFNFLGQLLEYEKQLRRENVLDTRQEVKSAPPLCSQKRVCRTDMRTSKLSLNISSQNNEASNIFIPPKSGDQSPTTALAKLSFDVPQSTAEENHPRAPDFKQFRSKSCYGDWLRDIDETRKPKEMNVTTAPKVLSPVKKKSTYGNSDEKHGDPSTQFSVEKYRSIYSSNKEERFSLQTLSHQSYSSSKGAEFFKSKQKANSNLLQQNETKKLQSECSKKHISNISMIRSEELVLKKEQTESYLVFRGSDFQPKASSLHPLSFNVDSYKRSDSIGTSGFGSESSNCFDNASESHIAASEWSTNLKSPLSPSESHLLEDLEMERDMCKTEPSSPRGSSLLSEDPDSFHDSGVTISPGCVWPRKRVANFDARLNVKRDKLKSEHFTEIRTWWFPLQRDDRKSVNQFSDSGLYRVQSCPGMLSHTSSNTIQKHSHFCSKPQERISHESCPDVGRSFEVHSHRLRVPSKCAFNSSFMIPSHISKIFSNI